MNDKNLHINNLEEKSAEFFSKGKINWSTSEADVWNQIASKIESKTSAKKVVSFSMVIKYAAAALIFLLVGIGSVTFFYSKTIECLPGEHILAELPDGSEVDLNAGSTMKYYPLKWRFERKLKFEGEGFFKVQKGKTFEVESVNGITRVLGTTFNIYARNNNYRVTCLSGKVKVVAKNNEPVTLLPNTHVELEKGVLIVKNKYKSEKAVSWKNNQFDFSETSLKEVFDEIERQYAITIQLQPELVKRNITINFSKEYNVEDVLDFVCKSMQLKFVKQSENVFLVVEKS